ncbi:hypothetical protein O181_036492 [Austropuccinia psidii MF-1]|uniref:Integrase catalytic domain-containing protein n=1 Tax=Austropuccinia psidii MF-1 TaxID=1389203 RepID=A0A9Q3D770_9BASI|nr:hypothetical protein [Austropuccinia psidii MF-1]
MDVVRGEETNRSAAASSSPCLLEMNLISFPTSVSLSPQGWNDCLGHACNKFVISFLKQHVPNFEVKSWKAFYCKVFAKEKSTHHIAKATEIPKDKPLYLLVSDIMGPFADDAQGFRYLLTIQDHVLTYIIVYPLKSHLEAPEAILDAIKKLQVHLGTTPKPLQTDNAREFTSTTFTSALIKLGVAFCPSLPYFPQENGEVERHNRTLGDMARVMMVQRGCLSDSEIRVLLHGISEQLYSEFPMCQLFATPSIMTLYPFGVDAIVHVPAVNQPHKLVSKGIECKLLKPLMSGGWLLWEPSTNKMVQSASVVFPQFQPSTVSSGPVAKGSLSHVVNMMSLGEVPTEHLFDIENQAIDSLILVKDVNIPEHLGEALLGPHCEQWRQACLAELDQMAARDVWEVVERSSHMKTIRNQWVFDLKQKIKGSVERFKERLVAHGDRQQPWVDCMETYAATSSLMSLHLVFVTAVLKNWRCRNSSCVG